jgi:hypothetical protein
MNVTEFKLDDNFSFTLVSFEKHLSYTSLAEELNNNHRQNLSKVDAVVIRPPVEIPILDINDVIRECKMLLERFPALNFYLLYSNNFELQISDSLRYESESAPFPYNKDVFLKRCRQMEMEGFVLQSQSIYRAPAQSVFRTPSQEYTRAFLRVGNIQNRRYVLDAIFFWLLPDLKEAGALLTDSWSVSSISLNVGRLYFRYRQHLTGEMSKDTFHVNFLTTFYHGKREMSIETREALAPLLYTNDRKILFLISAVKTKRSLEILQKEMKSQGFLSSMKFVALYALEDNSSITSLCCLNGGDFFQKAELPFGFNSFNDPPEGNAVIVVDEGTFFPSNPTVKELALSNELSKGSKDFFDRYLGLGAISVHRNAYFFNQMLQRHHGLFIDITILLKEQAFLNRLSDHISRLSKTPDLLICPPHVQADAFVKIIVNMIREQFGTDPKVHCFADLQAMAPGAQDEFRDKVKSLDANGLILVVDDVLTTGSRLKSYQKSLRELPYIGQIHYLVGVARPKGKDELVYVKRDLEYRSGGVKNIFSYVEEVFLPDWNKDTCPWCKEIKLLSEIVDDESFKYPALATRFAKRQIFLTQKESFGLVGDCFFSLHESEKAAFAGGSIFSKKKEISEAELICRISASIHHLKVEGRTNGGEIEKLGIEFPMYTIIRSDDYLGHTFNEALIKAAILRSCNALELYAVGDVQMQRQKVLLRDILTDGRLKKSEKSFFIYEIILALRAYKLPSPNINKNILDFLVESEMSPQTLVKRSAWRRILNFIKMCEWILLAK